MLITQVISKIFTSSQVNKSQIKTKLDDMDKENTEVCDITQAKSDKTECRRTVKNKHRI